MSDRTKNRGPLPSFGAPPLVEVVLGVQFESGIPLASAHAGLFWKQWQSKYPRLEEHDPIEGVVETFARPHAGSRHGLTIATSRPKRSWFISADGTELLQFQRDFFCHNWRRTVDDVAYPRYATLRSRFADELRVLAEFVSGQPDGRFSPRQVEITYINHISATDPEGRCIPASALLSPLLARERESFLGGPESTTLSQTYLIHSNSSPVGRLHVTLNPVIRRSDDAPLHQFQLTARGAPSAAGLDGVLSFLDLGHEWIVRGFTDLTSPTMHREWRLQDAP